MVALGASNLRLRFPCVDISTALVATNVFRPFRTTTVIVAILEASTVTLLSVATCFHLVKFQVSCPETSRWRVQTLDEFRAATFFVASRKKVLAVVTKMIRNQTEEKCFQAGNGTCNNFKVFHFAAAAVAP